MIIGYDSGNRMIKTAVAPPFSAGLNSHGSIPPIIAVDTIAYKGNYYSIRETQGYHRRDKTKDDTYYILGLAAIAREIVIKTARAEDPQIDFDTAMKNANRKKAEYKEEVLLCVGLPPRDVGYMGPSFKDYFIRDNSPVQFKFNNISFEITIKDVIVSPQGFAAVFPNDIFSKVSNYPQSYIVDIGGYTTDVARIVNRKLDAGYFESLDFGVIHLINDAMSAVGKHCGKEISPVLVEAVLKGENIGDWNVERVIKNTAKVYAEKIVSMLIDKGVDLSLSLPVMVGGGSILLKNEIHDAMGRENIFTIEDVCANAIGYEVLGKRITRERERIAAANG